MRSPFLLLVSHFLAYTSVTAEVTADITDEVIAEVLADEDSSNVFELLGKGIQKELQTVRQPIDEAIIHMGSSSCAHLQKLFGMSHDQMKEEAEPSMDGLTLVYKTKYFTTIMNITTAVEALRRMRQVDRDERLIMFVHGFTDNPTKDGFTNLTRSFFAREHVSLLALDASSHIRWLYLRSSSYVRFIGTRLGQVLAATLSNGQDPSLIHIIGNSLGGRIAGFAGKAFTSITGKLIGRISGLDPAGPCFSHVHPDLRLKHTDAAYVDVIHTNAGIFGIRDALGHKDFYPNRGTMQPNCMLQSCSHTRSWLLYGESVMFPRAFPAVRCKDWAAFEDGHCEHEISYMGYASKADGETGLYFLQTDGDYPYGLGLDGVQYKNNDGFVQTIGNFFG